MGAWTRLLSYSPLKVQKTTVVTIPDNLDTAFSTQSKGNESISLRESVCMRCWQKIFDTREYAEMWQLNTYNGIGSAVSLEDLEISTRNECTWCRLLKTHVDDMIRGPTFYDPETHLLVSMDIQPSVILGLLLRAAST